MTTIRNMSNYVDGKFSEWAETGNVGSTLYVGTKTYQVMSDIWEQGQFALVWNFEAMRVEQIDWVQSGSVADATPDIQEMAKGYLIWKDAQIRMMDALREQARQDAVINKGDEVAVVSGRSGKGAKGKVVVIMTYNYKAGWRSNLERKFGIATSDKKIQVARNGRVYDNYADMVWAWARNCSKLTVPQHDKLTIQNFMDGARARYNKSTFADYAYYN